MKKISILGISKASFYKNIIAGLSDSHGSPYKKASNIAKFVTTAFGLNNQHEIDQLFYSNRVTLKRSKELINCPDCGTEEKNPDHAGFTFPSRGDYFFIVCQGCGRRTFEDNWSDPLAPEAPFEESEMQSGIEEYELRKKNPLEISEHGMTPFVAVFTQDFSDAEIIPHTISPIKVHDTYYVGQAISYCLKEQKKCIANGYVDAFFKIGVVDSEGVQFLTEYKRGDVEI